MYPTYKREPVDTQLQHDPRTKQQVKDALYEHLYAPVQRQYRTRLDGLIIKNTLLGKYSHKSFNYKGVLYSCDAASPPRKANRLVPELYPEMEAYLTELKELNDKELPYVLGFINQVLNASDDFCDYLSLLPNALHPPIQKFIDSCPCRTKHLSGAEVTALQTKNASSIDMVKNRMVTNLLL